jgi:hypothetical protein
MYREIRSGKSCICNSEVRNGRPSKGWKKAPLHYGTDMSNIGNGKPRMGNCNGETKLEKLEVGNKVVEPSMGKQRGQTKSERRNECGETKGMGINPTRKIS